MFALPNLSAQIVEPCRPWDWVRSAPEKCHADKKARDDWATNPNTQHQMYSPFEGLNSSLRVSEQNHPIRQTMVVGDHDLAIGEVEMKEIITRLLIKPNWLEHTLSGNWRLIWLLERPIPLASIHYCRHILRNLETFFPLKQVPGLDEGALLSFSRYYTNSGKWTKVHDTPVSWESLEGWLVKLSSSFNWREEADGVEIDFKVIAARLRERHPRFCEWEGDFVLGAQGPTFWIEGSASPKSANVRDKGIHTFSAHAQALGRTYWTWADLCGVEWVKAYEQNRIGKAVKDIHFDDKQFFVFNNAKGQWMAESKENVLNELLVSRGLGKESGKKAGRKHSEIDEAVNYIRHHHRIAGAAPFAFYPKGIMQWNGATYLNTHTREVLQPAKTGEWGKDFPWLSMFLDQFFALPEQKAYFLSWLSRFYKGCYHRSPKSGQSVFISGPTNAGKTFLNRGILSPLMGGHAEAKEWLLGKTSFNAQLFESALWPIDDGSVGTAAQTHRYFSEMVKMLTANRDMESHAKFGKPSQVGWQGRLCVTCNDDAESLRILPRLDISILEKLLLFRAAVRSIPFTDEMDKTVTRELPFFARFLLDFEIPSECLDPDPRYGVRRYHDKELVSSAITAGDGFDEVLDHWLVEHFTTRDRQAPFWEGTSLQLRAEILRDPAMVDLLRAFDLDEIKRRLIKLSSGALFHIEVVGDEKRMKFRIYRGEQCPLKTKPAEEIPAPAVSQFEKV